MLFDTYFCLAGFYLGMCAYFAHTTKAGGAWHAVGITLGAVFIAVYWWFIRWHLRHHAQDKKWPLYRRLAPLACYVLGIAVAWSLS